MLVAATSLAACNIDISGLGTNNPEGSYSLRSINGYSLPYTFNNGLSVSSETLTLSRDGTWVDVARYTNGQVVTYYGYYTERNNNIQFTDQSSQSSYDGTLNGDQLTQYVNGFTQSYRRQ